MRTIHLELNEQEGQVLLNLINIAVQVKGLEAAEAGVHFAKKINDAFAKGNGNHALTPTDETKTSVKN